MVKPFKLAWPVGHSDSMNKEDIENTKRALDALGLYEPPQLFTERFSTEPMIQGLKKFQRREGLEPDGVMNPDGPTLRKLNAVLNSLEQSKQVDQRSDNLSHAVNVAPKSESGDIALVEPAEGENKTPLDQQKTPIKESSTQVAVAPAAAPFALWLMELLGTATIAAAMAIYNSWSKDRQKAIRNRFKSSNDGSNNECWQRYNAELGRCRRWPETERNGCRERATIRWDMCNRNGGKPNPNEPPEWSEADMR